MPDLRAEPLRDRWGTSGRAKRELLVGVAVLVAVAGLGFPLGVLWSVLSPRVLIRMTGDGPVLAMSEPEEYMGAEAVFTLMGLGVGIAAAVVCWLILRRWRGPMVLLGLMVGSLLAACIARQLGQQIGLPEYTDLRNTAQLGWEFYRPPTLKSGTFITVTGVPVFPRGSLVAQALAAVFTYTMFAGWSRFPNLRSGTHRSENLSVRNLRTQELSPRLPRSEL